MPVGIYCELFGNTVRNKVMQYVLIFEDADFAVSQVAEDAEISRPKAYQIIEEFEKL